MTEINVSFLGDAYSFPSDILKFIKILRYFDSFHEKLNPLLLRLMDKSEWKDGFESGVTYFKPTIMSLANLVISKLSRYNIFDITASDLVDNNPGYINLMEVGNTTLEEMKKVFSNTISEWIDGYDIAKANADSKVTGMGFSIWTSSLSSALLFSAMEASTVKSQQRRALQEYNESINKLRNNTNNRMKNQEKKILVNYYYPAVAESFAQIVTFMMKVFISKLDENRIIDFASVEKYNLTRSSELLNNLRIVNDKRALLSQAFSVCPYNPDVYINAALYGLLSDVDTIKTAEIFMQKELLIESLKARITKLDSNCDLSVEITKISRLVSALSLCNGVPTEDIYKQQTANYHSNVVSEYENLSRMANNKRISVQLISDLDDNELSLLSEESLMKLAEETVRSVITIKDLRLLSTTCGYYDLLDEISPSGTAFESFSDLNDYLKENICANLLVNLKEEVAYREEKRNREVLFKQEWKEKVQNKRKKKIKIFVIGTGTVIFATAMIISIPTFFIPLKRYNEAISFFNNHEYDKAINRFSELGDFKDSEKYIKDSKYSIATDLLNEKKYENAYSVLKELGSYRNADQLILQTEYERGVAYLNNKEYDEAYYILAQVGSYNDAYDLICKSKYDRAMEYISNKEYDPAYALLEEISDYSDAQEQINKSKYDRAMEYYSLKEYEYAYSLFGEITDYSDAEEKMRLSKYSLAMKLLGKKRYKLAYSLLESISDYSDSQEQIYKSKYNRAKKLMKKEKYEKAIELFNQIPEYSDSLNKAIYCENMATYNKGLNYENKGHYMHAITTYDEIKGFKKADVAKSNCMKQMYDEAEKEELLKKKRDKYEFLSKYNYKDCDDKIVRIDNIVASLEGSYSCEYVLVNNMKIDDDGWLRVSTDTENCTISFYTDYDVDYTFDLVDSVSNKYRDSDDEYFIINFENYTIVAYSIGLGNSSFVHSYRKDND